MNISKKYAPGLLFVSAALMFGIDAALNYKLGTFKKPGPGFFPVLVSIFLFLTGIVSIVTTTAKEFAYIDVKALLIIVTSLLSFALFTAFVNMTAGIVALVLISSLANKEQLPRYQSIKIIAVLILVAAGFKYALGMNIQLWN